MFGVLTVFGEGALCGYGVMSTAPERPGCPAICPVRTCGMRYLSAQRHRAGVTGRRPAGMGLVTGGAISAPLRVRATALPFGVLGDARQAESGDSHGACSPSLIASAS
jgi:hypothetical protein